ncbi:hypothetical protein BC936DRAFT_145785 [Jimgerdemannia flammicorona]|uniref:Uncharacterized protein n=1 Tax=Jimgerdemannia flammicorona TaxID=994334 RepID=A0A433D958_9FUNG|nr:hypothetical protein BC936DRAFT_145785 [Jimgerdemannia flammicorona]
MVNDPFDFTTTTNPYSLVPDDHPTSLPHNPDTLSTQPLLISATTNLTLRSHGAQTPTTASQQTSAAVQAALTAAAAQAQAQAHAHHQLPQQAIVVPLQGSSPQGPQPMQPVRRPSMHMAVSPPQQQLVQHQQVSSLQPQLATAPSLTTNFEEIQSELKKVLDHVEQGNVLKSFEILSSITDAVVTNCEQLDAQDGGPAPGRSALLPPARICHRVGGRARALRPG